MKFLLETYRTVVQGGRSGEKEGELREIQILGKEAAD